MHFNNILQLGLMEPRVRIDTIVNTVKLPNTRMKLLRVLVKYDSRFVLVIISHLELPSRLFLKYRRCVAR